MKDGNIGLLKPENLNNDLKDELNKQIDQLADIIIDLLLSKKDEVEEINSKA